MGCRPAATGGKTHILLFESELRALCVFVAKFPRVSAIGSRLLFFALLLFDAPVLLADDQVAVTVQHPWMRAVPDVMDSTAVTLCRDNHMLIRVFKLTTRGNIKRVVMGENIGTVVGD